MDVRGSDLIALERQRQLQDEGWTDEHDDKHCNAELVKAARAYLWVSICEVMFASNASDFRVIPSDWPTEWDRKWFKPSDDPIRNLTKAGALISAEIDRLRRTL